MKHKSRRKTHHVPSLAGEIAHLNDLDLVALQRRWRTVFRRNAPAHLPRHLLVAVLAYRLQADAYGDLAPATIRLLEEIGSGTPVTAVRAAYEQQQAALRPGTILMREWNNRPQRVTVTNDGFVWEGKTFNSLSAVALAVTGTKWNGHRFFGLRDAVAQTSAATDVRAKPVNDRQLKKRPHPEISKVESGPQVTDRRPRRTSSESSARPPHSLRNKVQSRLADEKRP